jgi:hypothetical protein
MKTKIIAIIAATSLLLAGAAIAEILRNLTALTGANMDRANDRVLVNDDSANTDKSATIDELRSGMLFRIETLTDAATVTPAAGNDGGLLTTLSQSTTIANPTGTPVNFQRYVLRIESASAQTLSFGAQFRWSTDMPAVVATSGSGLTDYLVFQWNSTDSKWDVVGKNFGF